MKKFFAALLKTLLALVVVVAAAWYAFGEDGPLYEKGPLYKEEIVAQEEPDEEVTTEAEENLTATSAVEPEKVHLSLAPR